MIPIFFQFIRSTWLEERSHVLPWTLSCRFELRPWGSAILCSFNFFSRFYFPGLFSLLPGKNRLLKLRRPMISSWRRTGFLPFLPYTEVTTQNFFFRSSPIMFFFYPDCDRKRLFEFLSTSQSWARACCVLPWNLRRFSSVVFSFDRRPVMPIFRSSSLWSVFPCSSLWVVYSDNAWWKNPPFRFV